MSACATCSLPDPERLRLEGVGALAANGEISWAEAARRCDLNHANGLKAHMAKHVQTEPSPTELALDEVDGLIAETIEELKGQLRLAPIEVKPFYAAAIRNLAGLMQTQPSQAHLITALKAIHEVTGMKLEQKMMLQFAQAAFPPVAPRPALREAVLDLESVEA